MCCSPTQDHALQPHTDLVQRLIQHSPPKSCASSCGKVESSEQSRLLLLRLCDVGLAASWLLTLPGPVAKLATDVAGVVLCRLGPAGGTSAGITSGTSLRPSLGVFARPARLATLAAACRGGGLPLLPVTVAGVPLPPSEE